MLFIHKELYITWKNDAKSLPAKTLEALPDGSELVMMRESDGMLARQEAGGLLLIHTLTAAAVARAAVQAGADPRLISFAPALALIRDRVTADACCPHCGRRPVPAQSQVKALIDDIAGLPRHRPGRQRTSPGPPPNAATATPRTSVTPSLSKNRISQNGT